MFVIILLQETKNSNLYNKNYTQNVNLDLPKISKITINFELLNVSKMSNLRINISPVMEKLEALNLNSRVNFIQRVLLHTLPQKELTSLTHIHVTLRNFFISSLRGYCYQMKTVKTT